MWLWSKGLGRLVLPMDLGKAEIHVDGGSLIVKGWVIAPKVYWDYSLSLDEKDLLDVMRLLAHRRVVRYLAREGGLSFLGLFLERGLRFGLGYLWAGVKRLTMRGQR